MGPAPPRHEAESRFEVIAAFADRIGRYCRVRSMRVLEEEEPVKRSTVQLGVLLLSNSPALAQHAAADFVGT